ncbi:ABC transporter ATP-binding protein [Marinomonas transparens]|uniref:ABC transporter ATP-binding protein n=1 Tax=Marinomonas transparens TaxID=2795388 RepID=A0A934N5N2_9GAMM|nr:ABC transporter ATP-binding protein [Marinomonas transparens]MBJ7537221.1 ABC transporter ATP-binding protein [Marinomonas transparens]
MVKGVELINTSKSYDGKIAVDGIDLKIASGSYCCLLGPSGCGKSTTLRMIAGHEEVTSGDIVLNSRNVTDLAPRKRGTAMMFQNYALFPHLSCVDNVAYGLKIAGLNKADRTKEAMEMLDLVNMASFADKRPDQLSGGQQQRIALARALICKPDVVLLDEPLSALDPFLRIQMRKELKQLQSKLGLTFIHVTHSQEEAFALADLAVVMADGVIQQQGHPKSIFEKPASAFVADFIGGHNVLKANTLNDPSPLNGAESFSIRSDKISLAPLDANTEEHHVSIKAEILDVEFQAQFYFVETRLADGQKVMCYIPEDQLPQDLAIPALHVQLSWALDNINPFHPN